MEYSIKGDKRWREGFQDMNVLLGYPQLKYSSDLKNILLLYLLKLPLI